MKIVAGASSITTNWVIAPVAVQQRPAIIVPRDNVYTARAGPRRSVYAPRKRTARMTRITAKGTQSPISVAVMYNSPSWL